MKSRFRILLILAAVLALILTGCGGNAAASADGPSAGSAGGSVTAESAAGQEEVSDGESTQGPEVSETEFELLGEEPEIVTPEEMPSGQPENVTTEEMPSEEDHDNSAEAGAETESEAAEGSDEQSEAAPGISESDTPTEKDELAAYIHAFGHLPDNFITKNEAKELGWVSSQGNLWDVAPGCSIGGDRFGNYEGNLPDAPGRKYTECDVGYEGGRRDARRIVFSNDGLIYYTEDHYETFELLYGEES